MMNSQGYENEINGRTTNFDFSKLVNGNKEDCHINDFMIVGPFVMETDGAFETEYFYERDKILNCDYLSSSGGEKNVAPYIGMPVKNDFLGKNYLYWRYRAKSRGRLRFEEEGDDCENLIFSTEQRNCVYYAATYIECDKESDAVITYQTSGCSLYLNGELVDFQPYGRVKGLSSMGHHVAVTFQKGKNLLMFKIRAGYIADGLDLTLVNCFLQPIFVKSGNLGVSEPLPTVAYVGEKQAPRQVFISFAGAFGNTKASKITYTAGGYSETVEIPKLKRGQCKLLRVSVPTLKGQKETEINAVSEETGAAPKSGKTTVNVTDFDGFECQEHMRSDFHFDTTYHQEQRTYAMGALHITKCIVDELIKNPHFKAVLSEVDYLHPYYSIYPEHREALKKAFEEGRAEADCFYNQPNDLTSSGEGFVRNLVYGQLYHRDVLGRITYVYAPGDVFGHPNQMSQICTKGGCIAAEWGKTVWGLDDIIRHVSPDGTSLLHEKSLGRNTAKRLGLTNCMRPGGIIEGVSANSFDAETTEWMETTVNHTKYSTFSDVATGILEDIKDAENTKGISKVGFTSRDLTQHHSGVLLTRTDFKQANRLAENLLITAEKFSAIAAYYGADYPEKALDKAWRQLLCAQHHDSITGTNNEVSFVDLMIEYRESVELAADIVNRATAFLASGVKVKKGDVPYFIFNPHTWERTDVCEITLPQKAIKGYSLFDENGKEYALDTNADGETVKATALLKVPAMGYATYFLRKSEKSAKKVIGEDNTIENSFYRITVDENMGGGIVSVYDKKEKKEVLSLGSDGPANRIVVLKEVPDRMETQHELYTTGHKLVSSDYKAEIKSEKCANYEKLTVTVKLDIVAKAVQEITLYKNSDRIDMKTIIEDYQGKDDLFTLTFPIDVKGARPVYDDRFAPHVCGKSPKKLSFQTHQYLSFSHSRIAPANQWIDFGPTVLLNIKGSGKNDGNVNIGMVSLIRCENDEMIKTADELLKTLSKKALPVTQYSDREQHGGCKIIHYNEDLDNTDTRFVLCVEGDGNEYEKVLMSRLTEAQREIFCKELDSCGKAILFIRDRENIYKKTMDVILIKAKDIKTLRDTVGDVSAQLENSRELTLECAVVAENTGKTDNYGVALLNKGTISCSVEGENLLNMMLFHTAEFYGNAGKVTGNSELVPEQKTHSFSYALYPHKGSYREADVYKKGLEFNDGLIALNDVPDGNNKVLPLSKSFVKSSRDFVITSFKAGGYPLASMKSKCGSISERGFAIRGFEPDGKTCKTDIKFSFNIERAESVNLLEEESVKIKNGKNSIVTPVMPHSIETIAVMPEETTEKIGNAKLGVEREVVEPTYIRSWEHDLGSMPIGYLSVAGSINKKIEKIDDVTYVLDVAMSNNMPDASTKGVMKITVPKGFKTDKTQIKYDVEPKGVQVTKITVKKPCAEATGVIYLNYEHDGQSFEDIFEFGYFNPRVEMRIEEENIIVTVVNETKEALTGELAIATPFETWTACEFNTDAFGNISPRTQKVEINSEERKEYIFKINMPDGDFFKSFWAAAKLMVNGRIHFAYDRKKGPRHNVWTHEYRAIEENNGSIEDLLKM